MPQMPSLVVRLDVMFSDKFLTSDDLSTNLVLTGLLFSTFPLILGRKEVRFMIFKFLSIISHPNVCLFIVSN